MKTHTRNQGILMPVNRSTQDQFRRQPGGKKPKDFQRIKHEIIRYRSYILGADYINAQKRRIHWQQPITVVSIDALRNY
jgi:hypothetical protein